MVLRGMNILPNYYSPIAIQALAVGCVIFPPIQFGIVLGVNVGRLLINVTSGQFAFP